MGSSINKEPKNLGADGGKTVKKTALTLIFATVCMMILISILFSIRTVEATSGEDYSIQQVNHTIEVMYNGYIFVNDTIQIVGNAPDGTSLTSFLLGFPYKYGSSVLRCLAYDSSGVYEVSLGVPLENRMGFYAVEINFPQPLNISNGATHDFTVGFVLSNNLINASGAGGYILDVPAYPSLTKTAINCSVAIILPKGAGSVTVAKDDGAVNASAYTRENLPAFTYSPANVTFSLTGGNMQLFDITGLTREVTINGIGEIEGSDSYYITSKSPADIISVNVILPPNASGVTAYDQFGRSMSGSGWFNETTNDYRVNFSIPMGSYKFTRFTVSYSLPSEVYINAQQGTNNFNITFPLFQHVDYYAEQASVTFLLPEGARIVSPENTLIGDSYSVTRSVFQETVTVNRQGISPLEDVFPSENVLQILYEYSPLWLSFRPTLWVWALTTAGCAVAVVWKRPKAPVPVAVPAVVERVRPEYVRSFVNSYEEKRKIVLELGSLEAMVRKGRVPRRRYKVRRKTLETRLDTLSRILTEFKEKMRTAGGKYADLMRQLEITETEINEVEANIKSIEARHSRGEISLETYRKLLADYQHRKENAETAINGILLRLREEIR
jgi:hypothetical protein